MESSSRGIRLPLVLVVTLFSLFFSSSPLLAQERGTLVGRVTDTDSRPLSGVEVRVGGLSLSAVSDRNGSFRMVNLPAGSHQVVAIALGYEAETVTIQISGGGATVQNFDLNPTPLEVEGIEVSGQRRGQALAMQQQRTSDNIKTVVSSEYIGRFPDPNAAEALQRMPGISTFRDQGEGRYILIRGSAPELSSMTINGERIPSPEGDIRYAALDVVPADLLAGIEVSKTLTPDQDADAIGGSVNLVTKRPGRGRSLLDFTIAGGYNELTEGGIQQFAGTFADRFGEDERWGLVLGGSYYKTERGSDNMEMEWDDEDGFQVLDDLQFRDYTVDRERTGITGTLDYQFPDGVSEFYVQGIFNEYSDQEFRRRHRVRPGKGDWVNLTATSGGSEDAVIENELKNRLETQQIMSFSAGGTHLVGKATLDYRASYSYAEEDEPDRSDIAFAGEGFNLNYDITDPYNPRYNITSGSEFDYNSYEFDEWVVENNLTTDTDFTTSADLSVPFNLGSTPATLKVGGKLRFKTKDRDNRVDIYDGFDGDLFQSQVNGGFEDTDFYGNCSGCYRVGQLPGPREVDRFTSSNFSSFEQSTDDTREDSDSEDYDADENVFAGYVMATIDKGNWRFIPGVRVEYTDLSYNGAEVVFNEDGDYAGTSSVSDENSYTLFLPGINVRYRIDDRTNIRAALTRSLARPNYWDLVPYTHVNREDEELSIGNSELDVTTSTNFDIMAERYFQTIGVISGGFFLKQIQNYVYESFYEMSGGPFDGYETTQPLNGGDATLYGFEVALNQQLTFLPGALSGLGIYGNYTWTGANAEINEARSSDDLPGQATHTANFAISYEKYGFSTRLAWNYFGDYIDEVGEDASSDRIHDDHLQLDLSAAYNLGRNAQLFLEVINLTDECFCFYRGDKNRPEQQEWYSRWGHFGIKITDPLAWRR